MAPFQVGLVSVGGQDFGVGEGAVVADQGEAAIAGGVGGEGVQGDVGVDREAGGGDFAVGGVRSGASGAGLFVGLDGRLLDRVGDPARGPGVGQGGGGGVFDGGAGFEPAARPGEAGVEGPSAATPASIRACRVAPSRAALAVEWTQTMR